MMYTLLFSLAGVAMAGWIAMIVFPTWSVTRRLAGSAAFPAYLAVLYLAGLVPLLVATGPGVILDFGSADGVVGLLATADVALVAWIHILAFDHLIGVFIYRDNMSERVVPLSAQSVILFLTLMFGPVGFLLYYASRLAKGRGPAMGTPSPSAG